MRGLFYQNNKNSGFTIIEMMASLAIFIVVSVTAVSIFITSVKEQRRAFIVQDLQDNARFIMELMVKEIRMSQAINEPGRPFNGNMVDRLEILNQSDEVITYNFDDVGGEITRNNKAISSTKIKVAGSFSVINKDKYQPRVTIKMRVWSRNTTAQTPKIDVQNTVALRAYEAE